MKDMAESPPLTNGISTSPSATNGNPPCLGPPAAKTVSNGFSEDDFPPKLQLANDDATAKPASLSRTSSSCSIDLNFQLEIDDECDSPTTSPTAETTTAETTTAETTTTTAATTTTTAATTTTTTNDFKNGDGHDDLERTHGPKTSDNSTAGTNDKSMCKDFFEDCLTVHSHNKEADDSIVTTTTCLKSNSIDTDRNENKLCDLKSSLVKSIYKSGKGLTTDERDKGVSKNLKTTIPDMIPKQGKKCLSNLGETKVSQSVAGRQDGESESVEVVVPTDIGESDSSALATSPVSAKHQVGRLDKDKDNSSVDTAKPGNLSSPIEPKEQTVIEGDEASGLSLNLKNKAGMILGGMSEKYSVKDIKEESRTCDGDGRDQSSELMKPGCLSKSEKASNNKKDLEKSNTNFKESKTSIHEYESIGLNKSNDIGSFKSLVSGKCSDDNNTATHNVNVNLIGISCTTENKYDKSSLEVATSVSHKPGCLSELERGSESLKKVSETLETQDSSDGSKENRTSSVVMADILEMEKCVNIIDSGPVLPLQIKSGEVLKPKENKCNLIFETDKTELIKPGQNNVDTSPKDSSIERNIESRSPRIDKLISVPESVTDNSTKKGRSSLEEGSLNHADVVQENVDNDKETKIKSILKNGMTFSVLDEVAVLKTPKNNAVVKATVDEVSDEDDIKHDVTKTEETAVEISSTSKACDTYVDTICDYHDKTKKDVEVLEKPIVGSEITCEKLDHEDEAEVPSSSKSENLTTCEESKSKPFHVEVHPKEETATQIVGVENDSSVPDSESESKSNLLHQASHQSEETQSKEKTESEDSNLPSKSEINGTSESICTNTGELSTKNLENPVAVENVRGLQLQAGAEISAKENGVPTADDQRTSSICSEEGNDGILISSDNDDSMGISGVGQKRASSVCDKIDAKRVKLGNGHNPDANGINLNKEVVNVDPDPTNEKKAPSKRPSASVNNLETKKIRASSDVSLSTEQVSKILMDEANCIGKSPIMSSLISKPLSNMDKAIERVAYGGLDKKERILMPLLRDLKNRNLKNITRDDLEELVSQRLCELVTESGELFTRERVQKLEQSVEHWKLKAASLQKQVTDMTMVFKKLATETKQNSNQMQIPIKITRSVGLQVVLSTCQSTGKNISPQLKNGLVQTNKRKNGGIMTNRNTSTVHFPQNASSTPPSRPPLVQKVVTSPASAPSSTRSPQTVSRPGGTLPPTVWFRPPNSTVGTSTATSTAVTTTAGGVRTVMQPRPIVKSVMVSRPAEDRVIDLTDEDDRTKRVASSAVVQTMRVANINGGTSGGALRLVSPKQLTGSTPGVVGVNGQRLAYMLPATAGNSATGRLQLFTQQPGCNFVTVSRPSHMPTIMLKNASVMSPAGSVAGNIIRTAGSNVIAGSFQQVVQRGRPTLRMANGGPPRPIASVVSSPLAQHSMHGEHHVVRVGQHPAPLPPPPSEFPSNPSWKKSPPRPDLKISKVDNRDQQGIILSWNMDHGTEHEEIASYQLYAYQENNGPPSTSQWKKVGDVKAMPLPMACTLTQFLEGNKYHFAVRAIDIHSRCGLFSVPGHIILPVRST